MSNVPFDTGHEYCKAVGHRHYAHIRVLGEEGQPLCQHWAKTVDLEPFEEVTAVCANCAVVYSHVMLGGRRA